MGRDGPTQRNRRTKQGRYASQITLCEIQECFDLPSSKACVRLGVGLTVLKRLCRSFGIERWPYRLPSGDGKAAAGDASGAASPAGSNSTATTQQAFSDMRLPAEGSARSGCGQSTRTLRPRTPAARVLRDLLESDESEGSASDDDEEWHAEEEGEEEEGADTLAPCQPSRLTQRQRAQQAPRRQPRSPPPPLAAAQQRQQAAALSGDLLFGYLKQDPATEGEASSPSGASSGGQASAAAGAVPGPSQVAQRISVPLELATSGGAHPAFLDTGAFLQGVRAAAAQLCSGSLPLPASPAPTQLLPGVSWDQASNAGSCPPSPAPMGPAWPDAVRGVSLRDPRVLHSPFFQSGPGLAGFPGLRGPGVWGCGPASDCLSIRDAAACSAQLQPAGSAVGSQLLRAGGQPQVQNQQLQQQPARLADGWASAPAAGPGHGPASELGELLQMWVGDDLDLPLPSPCGLALPAEALPAPAAAPARPFAPADRKLPPLGCVLHHPPGPQLVAAGPGGALPALGAPGLALDVLPAEDHPGAFFSLFPPLKDPSLELWH